MKVMILFTILLLSTIKPIFGHPPDTIIAEYDTTTKILWVTINHLVKNPVSHYINRIEIKMNGEQIIQQKNKRQIYNSSQKYAFVLADINIDDTLTITAYCNISGKKSLSIQPNKILFDTQNE